MFTNQIGLLYYVGGSLPLGATSYVKRQADDELYYHLQKGDFCYVLNSRQMGKSSLCIRTMKRLQDLGIQTGVIDMTIIGSQQISPEQWYASILQGIVSSFRLKINLRLWWRERSHLSLIKRFSDFLEEVLLTEIEQHIVIFIDEIDSLLGLSFPTDDFFALIRACYNKRVEKSAYLRLTFTLLGVATPSDLIADKTRTPFNIGHSIELHGFKLSEARSLLPGLQGKVTNSEVVLRQILEWTDGQPFLTQKLCQLVLDAWEQGIMPVIAGQDAEWVANLVRSQIIHHWELQDEPEHLKTISNRLLNNEQKAGRLLELYKSILKMSIAVNTNWEQIELCLSGLVVKKQGYLRVRNRIYAEIFNLEWVNEQLTNLRPYGANLTAWTDSNCLDESRLLQGQALKDAQNWALGKNLSDLDHRFLAASQKLEQREIQLALEAARAREFEARLIQEQKTAKLQRYLLISVSLALVIALGLGLTTFWQYQVAKLSEIRAIARASEALFASDQRLEALIEAIRARGQLHQLMRVDTDTKTQVEAVLRQGVYGAVESNHLDGHQEYVYSVAFSPDGQIIATGSRDKTIKLWTKEGKLLKTLTGNQGWVTDVVFSPDGEILASSDQDVVKLWTREGTLLKTLKGHKYLILDIAFSPNGQQIASAGVDGTVKLWQRDGRLVRTLKGHQGGVFGVTFSPDGQRIASASDDHTIKIWQTDGKLLKTLKGHHNRVSCVTFSPDGQLLISADADGVIKLWQANGDLKRTLEAHTAEIWGITFSPDGQQFVSTSGDKTIKFWNRNGTLLMTLNQGDAAWRSAFSPDGTRLASSGSNNIVKIWQLHHPVLTHLRDHQDWVFQVAFSPDGKHLASASWDWTMKLWTRDGGLLRTFTRHKTRVISVAFHPQGELLASGDTDGLVKLWHSNGKILKTFSVIQSSDLKTIGNIPSSNSESGSIAFSPDGQLMAAGIDGIPWVKLWRLDGSLVATLMGHERGFGRVRFSPDGKLLAGASADSTIKLWQLDGRLIRTLKGHQAEVQDIDFSPDGKLMVSGSHDRTIKLWKVNGKLIRTFPIQDNKVYGVAFSPDGQMIASGGRDGTVKLWQLDGTLIATLKAHDAPVMSVAFSPDGQFLASSSWDKTVIVWNLAQAIDLHRLDQISCSWVRDYLRTNADIKTQDRHLCDRYF